MSATRWTPGALSTAISKHLDARCRADDRCGEIEEEIKRLKAELAELEAVSWCHRKAQHRLVAVARRKAA